MGLFFASYLVKLGRIGGKSHKGGSSDYAANGHNLGSLPSTNEYESRVVKKQNSESVSHRTGSTHSGSEDHNAVDEAEKLI